MKQYKDWNFDFSKIKEALKKSWDDARQSSSKVTRVVNRISRFMFRIVERTMITAVRLSIIAIALILIYGFIESHPTEWANFVNFFKGTWEQFQNIWSNMFSFLG